MCAVLSVTADSGGARQSVGRLSTSFFLQQLFQVVKVLQRASMRHGFVSPLLTFGRDVVLLVPCYA
jgi:hypothetical protein